MFNLKPRDTQTKVKHQILEKYLAKWGYIISEGVRGQFKRQESLGKYFEIKFVYVDCFSYAGQYANEDGKPTYGSPIIGIEALTKLQDYTRNKIGFVPEITAILFEKERKEYKQLLETMNTKGFSPRLKKTSNFSELRSGDILAINGDYQDHLSELLKFTSQNGFVAGIRKYQ
jgi:three-Cys-motif partner protein